MSDGITKTERTELRSVVKNQFKVLRKELEQRKAEMAAQAERTVFDRFTGFDGARSELTTGLADLADEMNRKARDLIEAKAEGCGGVSGWHPASAPRAAWQPDRRLELRMAAMSAIEADVKGAMLRLERQEVDLLRTLSLGAIDSAEAAEFLKAIPAVGELVPEARLTELEASLAEEELTGGQDEIARWRDNGEPL